MKRVSIWNIFGRGRGLRASDSDSPRREVGDQLGKLSDGAHCFGVGIQISLPVPSGKKDEQERHRCVGEIAVRTNSGSIAVEYDVAPIEGAKYELGKGSLVGSAHARAIAVAQARHARRHSVLHPPTAADCFTHSLRLGVAGPWIQRIDRAVDALAKWRRLRVEGAVNGAAAEEQHAARFGRSGPRHQMVCSENVRRVSADWVFPEGTGRSVAGRVDEVLDSAVVVKRLRRVVMHYLEVVPVEIGREPLFRS